MNLKKKFAYNVKNYSNFVKSLHVRKLKENNKKKKSVAKKKRDKQNINKYSTILFSSYPILFSLPFFEQIKELTYLEYSSVYQAIYYTFFEEFLKGYFSN